MGTPQKRSTLFQIYRQWPFTDWQRSNYRILILIIYLALPIQNNERTFLHNWPAENASELTADDISSINEIAFIGLGTEHFEQMTPDAISGITPEQFSNLVGATGHNLTHFDGDSVDGLAVLSGFSAAQVAALSPDIISSYSSEISDVTGVASHFPTWMEEVTVNV